LKKNMGNVDRLIRAIIAVILAALAFYTTGWVQIVLAVLAIILVITAFAARCPLYMPFGIKTCKDEEVDAEAKKADDSGDTSTGTPA
jgi:hypothetical protein